MTSPDAPTVCSCGRNGASGIPCPHIGKREARPTPKREAQHAPKKETT